MLIISLTAAAMGGLGAPTTVNPLAPTTRGMLQCYRPNVALRTCQSIAAYQRTGPVTYLNKAIIPVSNSTTLETVTPVVVKRDAVWGMIRLNDLNAGKLRLGGQIMAPADARPVLRRIARAMAPMANKEVCTRFERSGPDLMAKVKISGRDQPD